LALIVVALLALNLSACGKKAEIANAKFHFIPPQESLVKGMDNFPATRSLVEVQLELNNIKTLEAVHVYAPDALGHWTTQPVDGIWGVAVVDKEGGKNQINNVGPRKGNLNLPVGNRLTLWFPDNNNLNKVPNLQVDLSIDGGKLVSFFSTQGDLN
jgi:hypothetical protein